MPWRLECNLGTGLLIGCCLPMGGKLLLLSGSPTPMTSGCNCGSGLGRDCPQCRSHTPHTSLTSFLIHKGQLSLCDCLYSLTVYILRSSPRSQPYPLHFTTLYLRTLALLLPREISYVFGHCLPKTTELFQAFSSRFNLSLQPCPRLKSQSCTHLPSQPRLCTCFP